MSKPKRWTIRQTLDTSDGNLVPELRTVDVVSLAAKIKSGTLVASTIGMENYVLYPYILRVECQSTADSLALLVDGSTIAIVGHKYGQLPQIVVDPDRNPLCVVAESSTIAIKPQDGASGTFTASLIMKRVPINSKINTGW